MTYILYSMITCCVISIFLCLMRKHCFTAWLLTHISTVVTFIFSIIMTLYTHDILLVRLICDGANILMPSKLVMYISWIVSYLSFSFMVIQTKKPFGISNGYYALLLIVPLVLYPTYVAVLAGLIYVIPTLFQKAK